MGDLFLHSLLITTVTALVCVPMASLSPFRRAQKHYDRIYKTIQCKEPSPTVIHVKPRSDGKFLPPATILHRCGKRSGCCESPRQKCSPKTKVEVHLYFFFVKTTRNISEMFHARTAFRKKSKKYHVERLTFTNHTECHCTERRNKLR